MPVVCLRYDGSLRIGIHTFTRGSLERAALTAIELGANCFQIFSASPRTWRAGTPDPAQVKLIRAVRERHHLKPLVIHAGYLINLASLHPVIRGKSITAFQGELQRAAMIGAEYVVVHPGAATGSSTEEGIAACVLALKEAVESARLGGLTVLLENTVGAGNQLGGKLEELASIRTLAAELVEAPVGYCLDTCHLLGAGYDLATAAGLASSVRHIEAVLGWKHVAVIHANDSKGTLGSHVDRHAGIGAGHIGADAFRRILRHPKLRRKPFILETPIDAEGDDRRNMEMLKSLAGVH